jgi:hypothetical protein
MEAIAEKSIRERLAETDMPATVQVPAHLAPYMTDAEALATLSTDSIVGEAQRAMRLLVPPGTATHAESAALAEPVMGPANFYTLCHAKAQVDMLTAEEKLELLAIMGAVTAGAGHPTITVDVAEALSPAAPFVPAPGERYVTRYLADRAATDRFWSQLKLATDNLEHKQLISVLWERFKALRYKGATPGCFEATPLTHPIHDEHDANDYWQANKPDNYTQRYGTPGIVWNCRQ